MYLHLGSDVVVKTEDIIAILDLENTSISKITRAYLAGIEKKGYVVNVSEDIPKSYVICDREGEVKVYISQISPKTLSKRAGYISNLNIKLH